MTAISLDKKLISLYGRQIAIISVAIVLSVFASSYVIENILIKKALKQEADYYWSLYQKNPTQPLPNTNNLRGYLSVPDALAPALPPQPPALPPQPIVPHHQGYQSLQPGYGRVTWENVKSIYYVSDYVKNDQNQPQNPARLYLFFLEENVDKLVLIFGILPLAFVLLLAYGSSWLAYISSKRLMSPLQKLAQRVSDYRFESKRLDAGSIEPIELTDLKANADVEVLSLIHALEQFNEHLKEFIERERNFTRDASHELRTPVAIIKGSLDMLDRIDHDNSEKRQKYLKKIRQTAEEMEQLIATLLLLAHNAPLVRESDCFSLIEMVQQIVETNQAQHANTSLRIAIEADQDYRIKAPEKAVAMVLENLIENAFKYTPQGEITISIELGKISVKDTGEGMSETTLAQAFTPFFRSSEIQTKGFGLGLPLVKKICESLGWQIELQSEMDQGTVAILRFPDTQVVTL